MKLAVLLADLADSLANRSVLEVLRWAARRGEDELEVLALVPGPLEDEVRRVAALHVVNEHRATRRLSGALQTARLHRPAEVARSRELRRRLAGGLDRVWLADLGAAPILEWVQPAGPVTGHLLGAAPTPAVGDHALHLLRTRVDRWVTGDRPGVDRLAALVGVDPGSVERRSDVAPPGALWAEPAGPTRAERREETRGILHERYGIPPGPPLFLAAAEVDFWHMTDAFAQACFDIHLARPHDHIQFVLLAGASTDRMLWPLRHDIDNAGLAGAIHVVRDDPLFAELLVAADGYLRTGRVPLPLPRCDELRYYGTPIVSTAGEDPTSRTAPLTVNVSLLDGRALREAALALLDDPDRVLVETDPPGHVPGPDSVVDWDVRFGGPLLFATLDGR